MINIEDQNGGCGFDAHERDFRSFTDAQPTVQDFMSAQAGLTKTLSLCRRRSRSFFGGKR